MPLPPCTLRQATPADADGIAEVHVATWWTTYQDLFPRELLESLTVAGRAAGWRRHLSYEVPGGCVFVAEESATGRILGFVEAGGSRTQDPPHAGGEVLALYVLKECQGRGLGRSLFEVAVSSLRRQGFASLLVWVAKGNPACAFYEHLGGKLVAEKSESVPGGKIQELAYLWTSLPHL